MAGASFKWAVSGFRQLHPCGLSSARSCSPPATIKRAVRPPPGADSGEISWPSQPDARLRHHLRGICCWRRLRHLTPHAAGGLSTRLSLTCRRCTVQSQTIRSARKIGSYLMWVAITAACITSSMFLSALAPNLLALALVKSIVGINISWGTWFIAFLPLGILADSGYAAAGLLVLTRRK